MQARVSRQHYMNVRESCLSIPLTWIYLEAVSYRQALIPHVVICGCLGIRTWLR